MANLREGLLESVSEFVAQSGASAPEIVEVGVRIACAAFMAYFAACGRLTESEGQKECESLYHHIRETVTEHYKALERRISDRN